MGQVGVNGEKMCFGVVEDVHGPPRPRRHGGREIEVPHGTVPSVAHGPGTRIDEAGQGDADEVHSPAAARQFGDQLVEAHTVPGLGPAGKLQPLRVWGGSEGADLQGAAHVDGENGLAHRPDSATAHHGLNAATFGGPWPALTRTKGPTQPKAFVDLSCASATAGHWEVFAFDTDHLRSGTAGGGATLTTGPNGTPSPPQPAPPSLPSLPAATTTTTTRSSPSTPTAPSTTAGTPIHGPTG